MKTLTDDVMELAGQIATDDEKVETVKVATTMIEFTQMLNFTYTRTGFTTKENAEKYANQIRESEKYFVFVMAPQGSDKHYRVEFIEKEMMKKFLEMKSFLEELA